MWGVLSDLSFGDLLLYVRVGGGYLVRSQVRPATGQTIYESNRVGAWASAAERPYVDRAWRSGVIQVGDLFMRRARQDGCPPTSPRRWRSSSTS